MLIFGALPVGKFLALVTEGGKISWKKGAFIVIDLQCLRNFLPNTRGYGGSLASCRRSHVYGRSLSGYGKRNENRS
ncbi:MAG: hypothetical protein OXI87_24610 [Albidovulum sp.]|nr:hypothetical protein [Albidovulum sp.]MDE0533257.1 hypothetical protein [Albidovulum sp.]